MFEPLCDIYTTNTTLYLRDLVHTVKKCRSAAEERALVAKETASIRKIFREDKSNLRAIAVIKLLYFYILGYPAHIGQVECLKLISSDLFSDKRIGYLGCMMLLDELAEIHVLLTNCIKKDMESPDRYVVGLALCTFASVCSSEMATTLSGSVASLLSHSDLYIKKKAFLCVTRIIRKSPELIDMFIPSMSRIRNETSQSLQLCMLTLANEMCENSEEAIAFLKNQKGLVSYVKKMLMTLVVHGTTPENTVHGVGNPFLQIRCLRFLKHMGRNDPTTSSQITDALAHVLATTPHKQVVGFSIIYEAVACIMAIETSKEFVTLAANSMGNFLKNSSKNVCYVGLTTLQRISITNPEVVARHKELINRCTVDSDDTIKKRAIELSFTILGQKDAAASVENLLNNIDQFSSEMKRFATSFIVSAIERHPSTNKEWIVEQFLKLIQHASTYIREDTQGRFLAIIFNCSKEQQAVVTMRFYQLLCDFPKQDVLIQMASWCVGEYGDLLLEPPYKLFTSEIVEVLRRHYTQPGLHKTTYYVITNSIIKWSVRDSRVYETIKGLFETMSQSLDVEIQQRAVEFRNIVLKHKTLAKNVYAPIPPLELDDIVDTPFTEDDSVPQNYQVGFKSTPTDFSPLASLPQNGSCGMYASLSVRRSTNNTKKDLLDLLSLNDGTADPSASRNTESEKKNSNVPRSELKRESFVAAEIDGITVKIEYEYPQSSHTSRKATLVSSNASFDDVTDYRIQMAATKQAVVTMEPASGTNLASLFSNNIKQGFEIKTTHSQNIQSVEPKLRLRITFSKLGNQKEVTRDVASFPETFTQSSTSPLS